MEEIIKLIYPTTNNIVKKRGGLREEREGMCLNLKTIL